MQVQMLTKATADAAAAGCATLLLLPMLVLQHADCITVVLYWMKCVLLLEDSVPRITSLMHLLLAQRHSNSLRLADGEMTIPVAS